MNAAEQGRKKIEQGQAMLYQGQALIEEGKKMLFPDQPAKARKPRQVRPEVQRRNERIWNRSVKNQPL
jgi:hypothetical protein